jgi:putative phosphotransacetylase
MATIKVEISARHVHLTRQDLDALFGDGYELKKERVLSQASDFAATDVVTVVGSKDKLEGVRIIGPCRGYTQVELSATDCYKIGVVAPIRLSGKVIGSGAVTLAGPIGEVKLKDGAIIAKRHIHADPESAGKFGLKNGQNVKLKIEGPRALIFDNVELRVGENFSLAAHIDTDEANAAGIKRGDGTGVIII